MPAEEGNELIDFEKPSLETGTGQKITQKAHLNKQQRTKCS